MQYKYSVAPVGAVKSNVLDVPVKLTGVRELCNRPEFLRMGSRETKEFMKLASIIIHVPLLEPA